MEIASVRVHRIVATAFHGVPLTPEHVVDHIDTNRRNNRPENLRWLTRLENALKNPITLKRIEFICGSVEAFVADPSKLRQSTLDPNFQWMRTVSSEEAKACWERMQAWAGSNKPSSGGSLGEWVFKPVATQTSSKETTWEIPDLEMARMPVTQAVTDEHPSASQLAHTSYDRSQFQRTRQATEHAPFPDSDLVVSETQYAVQRNWRTPCEFPCCPQEYDEEPVPAYSARLQKGAIFARNGFSESVIVAYAISEDRQSLWVMCEMNQEHAIKPWALAQVTFEDGLYVHANRGSFFNLEGAQKQFCIAQGIEWAGGNSIDDYC
jgi:hypothetical protein